MAKLTLIRGRQYTGKAAKLTVFLNGAEVGVISSGETKTFEIEGDIRTINLKCKMSNTQVLTSIIEDETYNLTFSAMSGKIKVVNSRGLTVRSTTQVSSFQIVMMVVVFIVFFAIGYYLGSQVL